MRENLDDLWFNYLIESPVQLNEKEKTTIKEWSKQEKYFRSKLNEKQIELFEEYDKSLSNVNRISEKNAFIKGVMFATHFLFEALYKNSGG